MLLIPVISFADQYTDARALKGLKSIKVICDVNVGDPKLLLRRLELIDETYTQLIDAGIQPSFIVAFRGPATKYVTKGTGYITAENHAIKKEIHGKNEPEQVRLRKGKV